MTHAVRRVDREEGRRRDHRRERGPEDAGFVGGFDGLLFGLLIFVAGTLLVATAWGVVDTKYAVDAAARQAVRTYVEAPDPSTAASWSVAAADETLGGYGHRAASASVRIMGPGFSRCARVTIEVSVRSPLLVLPWLGRVGSGGRVTAAHSEIVDPFRTGLQGVSPCA